MAVHDTIARPTPRTVQDTDMDRELNRQQIICMYFIVSFLTSNNQQDSILAVYTFGPLLRYLTSNVSGSKASFSYIESCLASTSLICLSFIHQPWFTEILKLMDPVEMIPKNGSPPPPLLEVRLPGELLHRAEGEGGLARPEHRGGLGRLRVHCSLQIFSVSVHVVRC